MADIRIQPLELLVSEGEKGASSESQLSSKRPQYRKRTRPTLLLHREEDLFYLLSLTCYCYELLEELCKSSLALILVPLIVSLAKVVARNVLSHPSRKQSTWMRRASSLALLVMRSLSMNNAASILLFGHLDFNVTILSVVLFAGGCAVRFYSTAVVCDEPIGDSKPPEVGDQAGRSCVASQGSRERDISAPGSTSEPCSDPAYLSFQQVVPEQRQRQVPADSIGSRAAEKSLISCSVSSEEVAATTSSTMRGAQLFSGEFLVGATDKGWLSCRTWEIREPIFKLNSTSIPRIPCDPLRCFTHDRLLRALYQEWVNKSRCSSWDDSSAVLPSIHRSLSAQEQHAGGAGSDILGLSSGDMMPASFSGHPHLNLVGITDHDEDPMEYTMSSPTAASGHCPNRPLPAPATFIFDSGASNHMTGNKELFTREHYQSHSESEEVFVTIADGRALRVAGVGLVTSGGINLPRVLHVEGMTRNILVSVSQLTREHDLRVVLEPKYFYIKELGSKRTVGQGYVKDGIYLLDRLSL